MLFGLINCCLFAGCCWMLFVVGLIWFLLCTVVVVLRAGCFGLAFELRLLVDLLFVFSGFDG